MASDDFPAPTEGFVLIHFIVAEDVARSRDFYTGVLGGTVVPDGEPTIVKLANGWVIINVGGGPTDDKPTVTLTTPADPNQTSAFLNVRCDGGATCATASTTAGPMSPYSDVSAKLSRELSGSSPPALAQSKTGGLRRLRLSS